MIWQFDHTKIKAAREVRGVTQQWLADTAGIKVQLVSWWETGSGTPNMESLSKLCTALDCPPKFFFVAK